MIFIGVKVFDNKKAKPTKSNESLSEKSCKATTKSEISNGNESLSSNGNDQTQQNVSYESNESTFEEEINEKWANPWTIQHENVLITTFNSPNDFYIARTTDVYVFDL